MFLTLTSTRVIKVRLSESDAKNFRELTLQQKAKVDLQQKEKPSAKRVKSTGPFATSKAGITGIIRSVEHIQRKHGETLREAFKDVDALGSKAKDLVELAARYV